MTLPDIALSLMFIVAGFLSGFLFQVIMKKIKTKKPTEGIKRKRNLGVYDRLLRAGMGAALVVFGFFVEGVHVVAFFVAGFCFFEALFSWCIFYSAIGKNTCPLS